MQSFRVGIRRYLRRIFWPSLIVVSMMAAFLYVNNLKAEQHADFVQRCLHVSEGASREDVLKITGKPRGAHTDKQLEYFASIFPMDQFVWFQFEEKLDGTEVLARKSCHESFIDGAVGAGSPRPKSTTRQLPNEKLQLTISKVTRLATPSLAPFAIAAELGS